MQYLCLFLLGAMTEAGDQVTGGGRSMLDDMVGVGDMVLLEPLSEDALIENLWDRYNNKDIYVSNDIQLFIITTWSFALTIYMYMPIYSITLHVPLFKPLSVQKFPSPRK